MNNSLQFLLQASVGDLSKLLYETHIESFLILVKWFGAVISLAGWHAHKLLHI